jgi:hypothetical protein
MLLVILKINIQRGHKKITEHNKLRVQLQPLLCGQQRDREMFFMAANAQPCHS